MSISEHLGEMIFFFFGKNNLKILYALMILVVLDYISGVCVAIKMGTLSSSVGAKGIAGKVIIFAIVSLSNIFDTHFLTSSGLLEASTILFYSVNEAVSILENAYKIGVPIPQKLKDALEAYKRDKIEK